MHSEYDELSPDFADACRQADAKYRPRLVKAEDIVQRLALSSAEFVSGFVPPDYLIEGLLQRRFIYSLTAATGTGKTAIALLLAALVSQGAKLGKLEVAKGRVLYFAGENPTTSVCDGSPSPSNSA
jgi:RecA-family ATPase